MSVLIVVAHPDDEVLGCGASARVCECGPHTVDGRWRMRRGTFCGSPCRRRAIHPAISSDRSIADSLPSAELSSTCRPVNQFASRRTSVSDHRRYRCAVGPDEARADAWCRAIADGTTTSEPVHDQGHPGRNPLWHCITSGWRGRRDALEEAVAAMFEEDFDGRVLPRDGAAAYDYAIIASHRRQAGKPISQFNAQFAAIARSRGAMVATRNVSDFEDCGIDVHNPWGQ